MLQDAGKSDDTPTAAIAAVAGPANFFANDFVIFQRLASLNVRSFRPGALGSMDDREGAQQGGEEELPGGKLNIFAATYESGMPMQGPVTVLLKEFPPQSRQMGLNELKMHTHIQARQAARLAAAKRSTARAARGVPCVTPATHASARAGRACSAARHCALAGAPTCFSCICASSRPSASACAQWRCASHLQALPELGQTWKQASADMTASSIAPALGWFESATSTVDAADWRSTGDSLWLVMKFEGLQPAQGFARAPAAASPQGPLAFMGDTRDDQLKRRGQFLRALFSGARERARAAMPCAFDSCAEAKPLADCHAGL